MTLLSPPLVSPPPQPWTPGPTTLPVSSPARVRLTMEEVAALKAAVAENEVAREAMNKLARFIDLVASF